MQNKTRSLELLSPAKNLECGISAINHGADSVYIGGPGFGARKEAGNPLQDIEQLIKHAHLYKAKVFLAINTLLFDHEIDKANQLIHDAYNIGADAVIIQDMGLLETNLPPIPIHASTQLDNRTVEKVQFLERVGFDQVVLARELNLDQIKEISSKTNVRLEYFIHGALCVCYSGQCYMSAAINGRSANRGECGQPCRLKYSLKNQRGKVLEKNKHLLSLKDLNLTDHLYDLIKAGITSFKIEGRLKDKDYVSNVTSHYRKALDEIINKHENLTKDSSGMITGNFDSEPEKSFNRGFTSYFINGRQKGIWNIDTPKSMGEKIGRIISVKKDHFTIDSKKAIHNGDGICFFSREKELIGAKINKVDANKIYPNQIKAFYAGANIYRNFDHDFIQSLKKDNTSRKIPVDIQLNEVDERFTGTISDQDGIETSYIAENIEHSPATNGEVAFMQIKQQLSKMGNTPFLPENIRINLEKKWFFPSKDLNGLRRTLTERHQENRLINYHNKTIHFSVNNIPFPEDHKDFTNNIINNKAKAFYERHGVKNIDWGFEKQAVINDVTVMTTKHCILDQQNLCLKKNPKVKEQLPLTLFNEKDTYTLEFDCKNCEMTVHKNKTESNV